MISTGSPLEGSRAHCGPDRPAARYAARLLGLLGADVEVDASIDGLEWEGVPVAGADSVPRDEATDWAESGAMALTGPPGGPPLVAPGAPASAARGAALAIQAVTARDPSTRTVAIDGAGLLGERAALAGLRRGGAVSPGGSCRLIRAADGLLAVNLSRPSDVEMLGAWLGPAAVPDLRPDLRPDPSAGEWSDQSVDHSAHQSADQSEDPWAAVSAKCAHRPAAALVERAQLVGIPVALVPEPGEVAGDEQGRYRHQRFPPDPWRVAPENPQPVTSARQVPRRAGDRLRGSGPGLVVDMSSMWAGPLCAHLLGLAGFNVVKVESPARPDGARRGPPAFYDLIHAGHRSVALDFGDDADLARLGALLELADIVIESSRPRALDQLGLGPSVILTRSPATVWVSITGYGRSGPWQNRVAFGDDAACAAGLIVSGGHSSPMFCGDAVADPLTGLHAALAALAMRNGGHGGLVDVPLRDVAASALCGLRTRPRVSPAAFAAAGDWCLDTVDGRVTVRDPFARTAVGRAAKRGADTAEVLASLHIR